MFNIVFWFYQLFSKIIACSSKTAFQIYGNQHIKYKNQFLHDVCVAICLFFCASIRFICKTFIQIFYLLLPEPCLVDMDCMDSFCSLLISAELKGFYTRIFVNNNYYSWQCNINRKNNGKLVENFSFISVEIPFYSLEFSKKKKKKKSKKDKLVVTN